MKSGAAGTRHCQMLYGWRYHKYTVKKMRQHMHRMLYGWRHHKHTVRTASQILYGRHYHKYTVKKMRQHMHRILYGWHYHKYTVKMETVHTSDFVWLALSQVYSKDGDRICIRLCMVGIITSIQ